MANTSDDLWILFENAAAADCRIPMQFWLEFQLILNSVCSFTISIVLSGPPRVSQSGVELKNFFECGFMASDDAYGSYKTYGKVRLKFGPP